MRRLILLALFAATAARAEINAIHRVYSIDDDGMTGTREEWVTADLKRREIVDHKFDQTVVVYDGKSGWRRDWNGFVEKLAGSDLRQQRDLALIHMLRFDAKSDPEVRFVVDPATGHIERAEMPSFDGTASIAFSDWRKVSGVDVPFTEVTTTGPNTSTAKLQSIEFLPGDGVDVTPPQSGPDDVAWLRPNAKSQTLPFNFDNNHIMILTTVNGVGPIWFLVDTGANFTVISQSRVAEFGLTPYGGLKTIGGGSSAAGGSYVQHVTYRFGDVELRDQHAAVLELKGLDKLYGMPLGGILGFDFLSRFVTDIDYVKNTLTLRPRTFDTSHLKDSHVPLVMQGEQPYFGGKIRVGEETIPAWFILDVGAADTITFTTPFIAKHNLIERAGDRERTVRKFAAPDVEAFNPTNIRGLIDAVTIGGITLPHVLVNLSAAKTGAYTSPAFDGNVCETILSRFAHVILDYGRSEMILQPQASTTKPFEERKSFGISVVAGSPELHHFTVTAVDASSAAGAAGFQKGDVIAGIDGTPAEQMNLAAVKKVFADEGSHHTFAVRRGTTETTETTIQAKIDLKPISSLR
ncbi:MAG TPA: retropepsin-like aspartic protease [Thermoanaerobaculia bacterium]|jgi:predicted aspartyl protease|nr:retropepsin-like aspartic protease [Thermoanaerobaculia bacterium]